MRWLTWVGGLAIGVAAGWACNTSSGDCSVGSEGCACTGGGACDPNLVCVSGTCVSIDCPVGAEGCPCTNGGSCDAGLTCDSGTCQDPGGVTSGPPPATTNASNNGTDDTGNDSTADDDSGVLLDVAANDIPTGPCVKTGCTQIDILFAIDSTGSMNEEVAALSASSAFAEIVDTLENLNCGVEYRVGVTNDNDGGFIGAGGQPWFDSQEMTQEEITTAFSTAANSVLGSGGTPPGCEHVLSSSLSTLGLDTTGFVRDDALLVLVLLTDVDDYGYYDQADSGGPCAGFLCQTSPQPVETIYNNLVTLKGGDPEALAAIVRGRRSQPDGGPQQLPAAGHLLRRGPGRVRGGPPRAAALGVCGHAGGQQRLHRQHLRRRQRGSQPHRHGAVGQHRLGLSDLRARGLGFGSGVGAGRSTGARDPVEGNAGVQLLARFDKAQVLPQQRLDPSRQRDGQELRR